MLNFIVRSLGKKAIHHTAAKHIGGNILDVRLGLTLLRDRRVPVGSKLLALALGGALMSALITMELPLEALWAIILPGLGFAMDSMVDGLEAVAGPLIIGSLLLQFLAPKHVVAQIRDERAGIILEPAA